MRSLRQGGWAIAATIVAWAMSPAAAQERLTCVEKTEYSLTIVAVRGEVRILTISGSRLSATVGSVVCPGDEISTGAKSSAEFGSANADTTTGISSNTKLVIPERQEEQGIVELIFGRLRILSSVRGHFDIITPLVNAGIDGTEAVVIVDGPAIDSLFLVPEGVVTATDRRDPGASLVLVSNVAGTIDEEEAAKGAGMAGFANDATPLVAATPDNVPEKFRELVTRPERASDWAIYYPPVLLGAGVDDATVTDAAALLSAGQPDEADRLLSTATLSPRDEGAALALRAVAAVFQNRTDDGLRLADEAVAIAPELGAAHIAQSYALQAVGQLETARTAAQNAVEAAPDDAYAWARLAELELTIGDRGDARDSVARSLEIQETALGRTIEGLAALSVNDFDAASTALNRAIEIDSNAPLPHLGLGLQMIRRGDVEGGRREIEAAVALDPSRANLRTWLARAYFEEGLGEKSLAQLALAKELDPDDPNAYLFTALQLFRENRPIQALREVEAAESRTDGRLVLRTEQGLGEDRAVLGSALGRTYDVLGFEQLAIVEGAEAVDTDPSNPGAHRFLADVLGARPGLRVSQTSELLRSQILSPPSKTPVQPELAEPDLRLLRTTGAARVTFAEFSPLFDSDGLQFDGTGNYGTQDTWGDQVSVTGLLGDISLGVGQFHSETDGFHDNNDVTHDIVDVISTVSLTPWLDLFGEYRYRESESGDRRVLFDPDTDVNLTTRANLDRELYRLGFHAMPDSGHDILGLFTYATLDTATEEENFPVIVETDTSEDIAEGQIQYIGQSDIEIGHFAFDNVQVGGSVSRVDGHEMTTLIFGGDVFPFPKTPIDVTQINAYGYVTFHWPEMFEWTVGFSVDHVDDKGNFDRTVANPKVGVRVKVTNDITLRAAYFGTLKRRLVADQTLEPTTIAGFSQFFDEVNGTVSDRGGVGMDVRLTDNLWVGAEATFADLDVIDATGGDVDQIRVVGYINATLGDDVAVAITPSWDDFESNLTFGVPELETLEVPVEISYFNENGLFGAVQGTYVWQDGMEAFGPSFSDDFFVLDATIGYRFPNQRGIVSIEAQNLFDEDFGFLQESLIPDLTSEPRFARERSVIGRLTLSF